MQEQAGKIRSRVFRAMLAGLVLLTAACSAVYQNHGFVPEEEDLKLITVGEDTRETVAQLVGRPTAAGLLNDQGWYYVQSRWRHFGPTPPKEEERQVVAITFDDKGVVENVERFGLEDGRVVALSRRVTETNVKGVGFLTQLLGNFGRVNPASLFGGSS